MSAVCRTIGEESRVGDTCAGKDAGQTCFSGADGARTQQAECWQAGPLWGACDPGSDCLQITRCGSGSA